MTDLRSLLVRPDGFVPKERYTTRDFAELEQTRLWSRVWQIACREEQVAEPGEFVEYTIGDEGVAIVRAETGALHAFYNTCLHRGRRLAEGCGSFADGAIRCPYHGWCYAFDGRLLDATTVQRERAGEGDVVQGAEGLSAETAPVGPGRGNDHGGAYRSPTMAMRACEA